jgi:hypothetical protein
MAITAATVIADVQRILNDEAGVRASARQLVPLMNQAQRDVMLARPEATASIFPLALVAGFKQSVPANAYLLLDVHANSALPQASITKVDLPLLDASDPVWRTRPQATAVKHFMHEMRNPRTFYVYPPVAAGTTVDFEASLYPDDVAEPLGDTADTVLGNISLRDEWQSALFCLTAHYAYLTDLEGVTNPELAMAYLTRANVILGTQIQTAAATTAKN